MSRASDSQGDRDGLAALGVVDGEIQERVAIPASTLTHHLRFLAAYLLRECCADQSAHPIDGEPHDHAR